jgi:hypothetical protein
MNIIGCDIGTMFCVCAKQLEGEKIKIKSMRNMFLPVSDNMINVSEIANTQIEYVEAKETEDENGSLYIIGEDSYRFANIFNQSVRRPMAKGVISANEIDALDVLTLMIEKLIGGKVKDGYCIYSVPAAAVDIETPPVLYHEKVFGMIFSKLGYKAEPLNEAMAIIFSECQKENLSGIAISFGAGLTNVVCSYKGAPTLTFAVSRGGDWIDENAASSLGIIPNRITSVKEKPDFDLLNPTSKNKKEKRVKNAISFYYKSLIEYVLTIISRKFNEDADGLQIDEKIPIIVSGGTSKPQGFVEMFKEVFNNIKEFPYDVSEIRQAKDPLSAVAEGSLLYAIWNQKRKDKNHSEGEKK